MRKLLFLLVCLVAPATANNIFVNFALANPALIGQSGQTVGWGFTLSVAPGYFATVTGSNYVMDQDLGSQVGYSSGAPGGIFESDGPDIIGYNAGPVNFMLDSSAPWIESFLWIGNPGSTGVRGFRICSSADPVCGFNPAVGGTEFGFLSITYQLSTDGVNWGDPESISDLAVSVTVAPTESAAVPEPATIALAAIALIALVARRSRVG
jgi:hypothetical protein